MASLFRPPESTRHNVKAPKLKLPTIPTLGEDKKNDVMGNNIFSNATATSQRSNIYNINVAQRQSGIVTNAENSIGSTASNDTLKLSLQTNATDNEKAANSLGYVSTGLSSTACETLTKGSTVSVPSSQSESVSPRFTHSEENGIPQGNPSVDTSPVADVTVSLSKLQPFGCTQRGEPGPSDSNVSVSPTQPQQEGSADKNTDIDKLDSDMWEYGNLKSRIVTLGVLGEGAGGSVTKCKLSGGSKVFALKIINTLNTDAEFQKQIFRELQFNRSFKSPYIVTYYGMFTDEENSSIYIAMEYMGGRSLDAIYKNLLKRGGRIGEKVLGKIAESVLRGLSYLHEQKVIHRDIKPQNILLSSKGEVKLCDFGVSGEAVNSLATTFTGTSFYMAPERIQGQPYSVTCDVWSLGLTILEVAEGHFPFGSDKMTRNIAPIELLVMILTFTPCLKNEEENDIRWSESFKSFIEYCLRKDPRERPSPRQMMNHPWIQGQMKRKVNMEKFIRKCWENDPDWDPNE